MIKICQIGNKADEVFHVAQFNGSSNKKASANIQMVRRQFLSHNWQILFEAYVKHEERNLIPIRRPRKRRSTLFKTFQKSIKSRREKRETSVLRTALSYTVQPSCHSLIKVVTEERQKQDVIKL